MSRATSRKAVDGTPSSSSSSLIIFIATISLVLIYRGERGQHELLPARKRKAKGTRRVALSRTAD